MITNQQENKNEEVMGDVSIDQKIDYPIQVNSEFKSQQYCQNEAQRKKNEDELQSKENKLSQNMKKQSQKQINTPSTTTNFKQTTQKQKQSDQQQQRIKSSNIPIISKTATFKSINSIKSINLKMNLQVQIRKTIQTNNSDNQTQKNNRFTQREIIKTDNFGNSQQGKGNVSSYVVPEKYNQNIKCTGYSALFYLLLLLYSLYFSLLLIPALIDVADLRQVTVIVFSILFYFFVIMVIIGYEKGRRLNPGYPSKPSQNIHQIQQKQNAQLDESLPHNSQQIYHLKARTIQLLMQKAHLQQMYKQFPNLSNKQKLIEFQLKFFVQQTKYCQKCKCIKDIRVRHCSQCNRCVQRMDHHCVWMNNCVGRNNHKYFLLFLLYLLVPLLFFSLVGIVDYMFIDLKVTKDIESKFGVFWKLFYLVMNVLSIVLCGYYTFVFIEQLYLISNNLTFVQSLSNVLSQKKPWKKSSCYQNFKQVFGGGCWICPSAIRYDLNSQTKLHKGTRQSVQLVEQNLTNFDSQNIFKNNKPQL